MSQENDEKTMSEEIAQAEQIKTAPKFDVDAKWDACIDLSARRFIYSSLAGALAGLLLFRSPVTRRAALACGAGIGIGSAYTECSYEFNEPSSKPAIAKIADVPSHQDTTESQE